MDSRELYVWIVDDHEGSSMGFQVSPVDHVFVPVFGGLCFQGYHAPDPR